MNWIETAWQQGVEQSRGLSKKSALSFYFQSHRRPPIRIGKFSDNYSKELVTPEVIAKFLDRFQKPFSTVLLDLQSYSSNARDQEFSVGTPTDDFIYLGDSGETGDVSIYPLLDKRSSFRGSTDYEVRVDYAFGRESVIKLWTGQYFCSIKMFPRINSETHFAGVEYEISPGRFFNEVIWLNEHEPEIQAKMQAAISLLYATYIEKQARFFRW